MQLRYDIQIRNKQNKLSANPMQFDHIVSVVSLCLIYMWANFFWYLLLSTQLRDVSTRQIKIRTAMIFLSKFARQQVTSIFSTVSLSSGLTNRNLPPDCLWSKMQAVTLSFPLTKSSRKQDTSSFKAIFFCVKLALVTMALSEGSKLKIKRGLPANSVLFWIFSLYSWTKSRSRLSPFTAKYRQTLLLNTSQEKSSRLFPAGSSEFSKATAELKSTNLISPDSISFRFALLRFRTLCKARTSVKMMLSPIVDDQQPQSSTLFFTCSIFDFSLEPFAWMKITSGLHFTSFQLFWAMTQLPKSGALIFKKAGFLLQQRSQSCLRLIEAILTSGVEESSFTPTNWSSQAEMAQFRFKSSKFRPKNCLTWWKSSSTLMPFQPWLFRIRVAEPWTGCREPMSTKVWSSRPLKYSNIAFCYSGNLKKVTSIC